MSMTITDGTTTLTFTFSANQTGDPEIDIGTSLTAGGRIRTQIGGERPIFNEKVAVTGAELRVLLNLLHNGASSYYYSPASTPPEYSASDFPMEVSINYKGKSDRGGSNASKIYYVDLILTGARYY